MMYSLEMLTKKRKFGRFGRSILVDLVDRPAKNPRKIDQIDQIDHFFNKTQPTASLKGLRKKCLEKQLYRKTIST